MTTTLPAFSQIRVDQIEPTIRQLLTEHRAQLATLLQQPEPTFSALVLPLEEMHHRLARTWSPIGHMNGVVNSDELRAAYNACLPLLVGWNTELAQNEQLFRAYGRILEREGTQLSRAQRKLIENALRDFKLAGVALPPDRKERFRQLMEQLTTVQAKFDENVLDATNAWSKQVTDDVVLNGLPPTVVQRARSAAESKQLDGWLFTLDTPNYQAVMMHATHAELRREFYEAWVTRASDTGPLPGKWDNTANMEEILRLRSELAQLVGFENYAQYSLATKMAASVNEVGNFLQQLVGYSRATAQREFVELEQFANRKLDPWDVAHYAEALKRERFALSEEALRPYFPLPRVLDGLFALASKLYGVRIQERSDIDRYHPDARYFDILEPDGKPRAGFYIDLYARPRKRGGAWMDECIGRKRLGASSALPVAYLVCNFTPPVGKQPSLLTHSEVVTLFHEFGHGLHHMLTRVDYPSIAGINGVAWDAVELPSQFMENFAWRPEVLPLISAHVETGEPLPESELQRLLGSRTFHAGMQTVRQLEFAMFDFAIHSAVPPPSAAQIAELLQQVRSRVAVIQPPAFNRFQHSFQHIFSGGYAAGYYSYKWAEVLAADAFSAFEESGVLDSTTAKRFLQSVLEQGGSRDPMEAFVEFRGRKPQIEPLLKQHGLAA
ncbi:MAG: M3 family metallopeptidase [Steroidobacteraceae bacterium]